MVGRRGPQFVKPGRKGAATASAGAAAVVGGTSALALAGAAAVVGADERATMRRADAHRQDLMAGKRGRRPAAGVASSARVRETEERAQNISVTGRRERERGEGATLHPPSHHHHQQLPVCA